ncbi:DEAD/DEAH box helicase [Microbacterium sp. PRF11]|uniref:DEAD/DEAH box helicase n=1 Tax=Microbacterium sp. PRF11 TaxID=2962593 RepID=UPI002881D9C9|nr:DEAD/DEAH box helicase [Microbacterium sp. PRF11]MDT0116590.1 DEAD/DEAH box helicase [Microbacterium sp. PRF11]
MTASTGTTPPADAGGVVRYGGDLRVTLPTSMSRPARLTLEQELLDQAGAERVGDVDFSVVADRAADLREILSRPWPAGRFDWVWDIGADAAAQRSASIQSAVDAVLEGKLPVLDQIDEMLLAAGFTRKLLPAQRGAVEQLVAARGGGNFSVPGSGKTTMTYAVFALLRAAGAVDRMLVVAPQSAYEAWAGEATDCFAEGEQPLVEIVPAAPRRRSDVLVFNYERVAKGSLRALIDGWAHGRRLMVVFDEAHRAKRGVAGLHGAGALDLASMAAVRLVLTGTPMPNGPDDLAAVLDLAWPGQGARLAHPHTAGASRSWVRITKDELELDAAEMIIQPVRLDDSHARIYRTVADGLLADPDLLERFPGLLARAVSRLIACASNPLLLADADDNGLMWPEELPLTENLASVLGNLGASARPAKLLAAARLAAEHADAGTKVVVWSNFLGNIRELERLLSPYGTAVITGAVPQRDDAAVTDRRRELQRFRGDADCTVLLATPQTLGEGVSLHKAAQAQVHVDRTYNAGLFLQAMDRTHRVGMPEGTHATVTVLSAVGTIDEQVDASLRAKIAAMDAMLADPTLARLAGVNSGPAAELFAPAELRELLGHLRGQAVARS